MDGRQALKEIRKIRPTVKAAFACGYSPDILDKEALNIQFIQKPITPTVLLQQVRAILDDAKVVV